MNIPKTWLYFLILPYLTNDDLDKIKAIKGKITEEFKELTKVDKNIEKQGVMDASSPTAWVFRGREIDHNKEIFKILILTYTEVKHHIKKLWTES